MIKKKIICFVVVLNLLIISVPYRQALSKESLKEASFKYAAIQAARVVIEQLKEKQIPGIVGSCQTYILDNSHEHQKITASKKLVKGFVEKSLLYTLEKNLSDIYQRLRSKDVKISEDSYKKEIMERFNEQINTNQSIFINNKFDGIFSRARNKAVKKQFSSLIFSVYPSQGEVNKIDAGEWQANDVEELRKKLGERIRKNVKNIFEENETKVKQAANEIITDINNQLQKQKKSLNNPISDVVITETEIIDELHKNVKTEIKRMLNNKKKGQIIYETFPSIIEEINKKAKNIERNRFGLFIRDFNFSVNNETLKKIIEQDLIGHREYDNSLVLTGKKLFPDLAENVVNTYSSGKLTSFRNRLKQLIKNNGEIRDILKSEISNSIKIPIKTVRSSLAEMQVDKYFYPISSGEWVVPELILKKISLNKIGIHSFQQVLELPFISRNSEQYNRNSLLVETENKVLSKVGKLLSEGKRAWNAQLEIVKNYEDVIEKELRNELETKSESQWISFYTKEVEKEWSEKRFVKIWRGFSTPPPNSDTKYSPLFGHVKKEIEKIVHNFFKIETERRKREEELRKQEEIRQMRLEEQRKLKEAQRKKEEERQKQQREKDNELKKSGGVQNDKANTGGKKSVEELESGGGIKLHPSKGGRLKVIPWWVWILLILLILILLILLINYMRSIKFKVKDLEKSANAFSEHFDIQLVKKTDNEAIFKKGFYRIILSKSE